MFTSNTGGRCVSIETALYLIGVLDGIKGALFSGSMVLFIVSGILSFFLFLEYGSICFSEQGAANKRAIITNFPILIRKLIIVGVVLVIPSLFIPSSSTAKQMLAANLLKSDRVIKIGDKLLNVFENAVNAVDNRITAETITQEIK